MIFAHNSLLSLLFVVNISCCLLIATPFRKEVLMDPHTHKELTLFALTLYREIHGEHELLGSKDQIAKCSYQTDFLTDVEIVNVNYGRDDYPHSGIANDIPRYSIKIPGISDFFR